MTEHLKVLYMQIREDEETRLEEFLSFVKYSNLKQENFTILNVFDTPKFETSIIDGHHALFVGGSSDASVLSKKQKKLKKKISNRKRCVLICSLLY